MSAATAASAACLPALHSGPSLRCSVTTAPPIGYEATMSVAMELDTKLLKGGGEEEYHRYSDDPSDDEDRDRSRLSQDAGSPQTEDRKNGAVQLVQANGHGNSREVSPAPPTATATNGDSITDHTVAPDIPHDDVMEDDLEDDEDDVSIAGHSMASDGHCSYADLPSVDNNHSRNDDTMDDDLHRQEAYKMHGGDVIDRIGSPERAGHHVRHHHDAMNGGSRPESSDGDYYDGAGSESSQHHLQHLHQPLTLHLQKMHQRQAGPEDGCEDGQSYQCGLCSFATTSKYQLSLHVSSHRHFKCDHCDYTSRSEGRLRRHLKDFHTELPIEDFSPGSDSGKLSSNGGPNQPNKVKTYRCKQCSFVATVKTEFWDHSKTHIKAERLLTCPRCPFVTEYKHHLEYHLRNHFGSKPFKCPKCNYSCVNKSMLNSHMKSHSNIYQYRCADCTYATKYCHSLKLHLRKYGHKPATVLNPDGSPNPMPVIDVYGTRRGPRPKKSQHHQDQMYTVGGNGNNSAGPLAFSPMQLPSVNGALSPTTVLPFFYGPPPAGLLPNGFHSNGNDDGHPQQHPQGGHIVKSQTPSQNNGVCGGEGMMAGGAVMKGGDGMSENGRYRCPSGQQGALRCNLCEFHTDHRDLFSKHMLSHAAAENQDLCNMYGISSETLMQDPNHQSPMNVAAMAAMASALGLTGGGGSGSGHPGQRPTPEMRHHQQHPGPSAPHHVGNQDANVDQKPITNSHQMHQGGFKNNGRQHQPPPQQVDENGHHMAPTMLPNPLDHLRGFSEQFNIQPWIREYSAHMFPTPSTNSSGPHSGRAGGGEGTSGDGLPVATSSPNGHQRAHNNVSPSSHHHQQQQQQVNQNKTPKDGGAIRVGNGSSGGRVLHSTPRSDSGTVPGLRPLDLSSTKMPGGRNMPWHHHHGLQQHLQQQYVSQQQFYAQQQHQQLQQLRGHPPVSPVAQLGPNRGGLLEIATSVLDDAGGSGPSPSCTTSPTQSKNRRKGRAFKLDRICMKLQKERTSPTSGCVGDMTDDSYMDGGGDGQVDTLSPDTSVTKPEMCADDVTASYDGLCIKTELGCDDDDDDVKTNVATDGVTTKPSGKCLPISPPVVQLSPPVSNKMAPASEDGAAVAAPKLAESNLVAAVEEASEQESQWKEAYQCLYCDMAFKDCLMYAVHMGYHGFKDPFKCNMCGQQSKDKVAFFLHIARTAHL